MFICPPLIKPFCVDSHRNISFVKTSYKKSLSLHRPYHIMNSFSKTYVLDPSGTAGPQLNARNEPVVPLVEPRVAPMLDERGSRPTIVAQIPPPLGRQARPQQGTLPLPQVHVQIFCQTQKNNNSCFKNLELFVLRNSAQLQSGLNQWEWRTLGGST